MSSLKSGVMVAVVVIVLAVIAFIGYSVYKKGYESGVNTTTNVFVHKIDSLNSHYPSQPPSVETTTIWVDRPPLVIHDSFAKIETLAFTPDSAIIKKYPKAIWTVSYSALNGELIVQTYDAHKFTKDEVGSFSLEGKQTLGFESSPWVSPVISKTVTVPFVQTNLTVIGTAYPDYTSLKEFGSADLKMQYGVIFLQRLQLSSEGGLGWDKARDPKFYPFLGISASYRLLGKY